MSTEKNNRAAAASTAYRTNTSFVSVHFGHAGRGHIAFLPQGAKISVIGPSSCLREGFEVMFDGRVYNVFEIDLQARCAPIHEPTRTKRRTMAACA